MEHRRLWAVLILLLLSHSIWAQDARSFSIGGAATAVPMDVFGLYWNPADLAWPSGAPSGWVVGSGFSAFDSSNAGSPILQFNNSNAGQSSQNPVDRAYEYLGIFGVRNQNVAGGVLYDQTMNYSANQSALAFLNDRSAGNVGSSPYNNMDFSQTTQQVADLVVSYAMPFPLGTTQFFSVGGSLKYHDGLEYGQTTLTGTFNPNTPGGYTYTKTTSNSGLGLSIDGGFLLKFTDAIQAGMMFENLTSDLTWQAQQQSYALSSTGAETPLGASSSVTVQTPYPYSTNLGLLFAPPGKNVSLMGEVSWSQGETHWSGGLEQVTPAGIAIRLGTFFDEVSQSQLWSFGCGYVRPNLNIDLSFVTRSLPQVEDSVALGGAVDVLVRF